MENFQINKFKKVLVANRGEIAIRVFRALSELGIRTVGIYSKEDKYSLFRTKADESYLVGKDNGPIDAYLDMDEIIKIAKEKKVDAIHPGYGFLSENPKFAELCRKNGIEFIGPDSETMERMGDKISSKLVAKTCKVPIIPGIEEPIKTKEKALEVAEEIGYPVIIKAANGGGGRGMRVINSKEEMDTGFMEAIRESKKSFGDEKVFIEKFLKNPKHIEVQILGDAHGNIIHLYERDCSLQRRHQKVIEYAPAFSLDPKVREKILNDAIKLSKEVNYKNAGTLEFLVDSDNNYYFIEMNPRIQVEHTVTEMITGIDIVQAQILIAEGYALNSEKINIKSQEEVEVRGYAIQCRVTTEDPNKNFMPDYGKLGVYRTGSGFGIRLDGGNGFRGAEITPYYDSLLVKTTAWDRTFEGAANKAIRSLKEMRVRGVKTNISFLINLLNHKTFLSGKCYTRFIEDTKEIYNLKEGKDRATKLVNYIGNIIVNESCKSVIDSKKPVSPSKKNIEVLGNRDLFLKMGAEEFTKSIAREKKLYITDTTMRDAHQSLNATRMRTKDILEIAPYINENMKELFSVEAWGGATFDVAYRFLKESPWIRLQKLREAMPNTLIQMLLRASNAVGYKNYPDNVVREFIKASAENGVDIFRIFDSLNWVENMKMPIEVALNTGKIVEGAICYTGDILNPLEKKYTLEYYIKMAKELESLGVHILAIKDMAGLLKPYGAKVLVSELKKELKIPVHLHTHDTTGNGVSTVLMAAEAGVDIVDLAVESMSGLTSQPSMNSVIEALKNTERDTGLDTREVRKVSEYFGDVRKIYSKFESELKTPTTEIYELEIPGGQYSNLLPQVNSLGLHHKFEEVKKMFKEANSLMGNIVKVTPSSKAVGDMAIFMVKNDLNSNNILEKGRELSFPESVVDYFKGMMGQIEGGFPKELQEIVLKGEQPITERPGALLKDEDFEKISKHLKEEFNINPNMKNILSYALYPKVYEEYCRHLELYNDVSKLESPVFFYGLNKGEETEIEIEEGKNLIIKYVDISEPDEKGFRTLNFEVNGAIREVEILDISLEVMVDQKLKADPKDKKQLGACIPGTIGKILVKEGEEVKVNQPLVIIEAMKMETTIVSKIEGTVEKIYAGEGSKVIENELLMQFK